MENIQIEESDRQNILILHAKYYQLLISVYNQHKFRSNPNYTTMIYDSCRDCMSGGEVVHLLEINKLLYQIARMKFALESIRCIHNEDLEINDILRSL